MDKNSNAHPGTGRRQIFLQLLKPGTGNTGKGMRYLKLAILALLMLNLGGWIWAASSKRKWKAESGKLTLHEDGKLRKSVDLYDQRGKEPIKTRWAELGTQMLWGKESKAITSSNGERAVHIQREYKNWGEGAFESTTTAKSLDPDGKVLWERRAVDVDAGIRMSEDGKYTALVVVNIDGCSAELNQECKKTILILDSLGNELIKLGPYHTAGGIELTKNGRYGMAAVWPGEGARDQSVFFDVEQKKVISKDSLEWSKRGTLKLLEDGTVELVSQYYEGEYPNRRLKREEVLEKFEIK